MVPETLWRQLHSHRTFSSICGVLIHHQVTMWWWQGECRCDTDRGIGMRPGRGALRVHHSGVSLNNHVIWPVTTPQTLLIKRLTQMRKNRALKWYVLTIWARCSDTGGWDEAVDVFGEQVAVLLDTVASRLLVDFFASVWVWAETIRSWKLRHFGKVAQYWLIYYSLTLGRYVLGCRRVRVQGSPERRPTKRQLLKLATSWRYFCCWVCTLLCITRAEIAIKAFIVREREPNNHRLFPDLIESFRAFNNPIILQNWWFSKFHHVIPDPSFWVWIRHGLCLADNFWAESPSSSIYNVYPYDECMVAQSVEVPLSRVLRLKVLGLGFPSRPPKETFKAPSRCSAI